MFIYIKNIYKNKMSGKLTELYNSAACILCSTVCTSSDYILNPLGCRAPFLLSSFLILEYEPSPVWKLEWLITS